MKSKRPSKSLIGARRSLFFDFVLTIPIWRDIILKSHWRLNKNVYSAHRGALLSSQTRCCIISTERYRSGHNEAVLKTVWVHAHVGSNPTPSATKSLENTTFSRLFSFSHFKFCADFCPISRIFLAIFNQIKSPENLCNIRLSGFLF